MSTDQLIKAAGELSLPELETLVSRVIALQARRKAPSLAPAETELLEQFGEFGYGLPGM